MDGYAPGIGPSGKLFWECSVFYSGYLGSCKAYDFVGWIIPEVYKEVVELEG